MFFTRVEVGKTAVHRMHPFIKMGVGFGFTVYALIMIDPRALMLLLLFFLATLLVARISLSAKQWLGALIFLGLLTGLNFWASSDPAQAAAYSLRLAVFIVGIPVLAATTAPQEMARALSRLPLPPGLVVAVVLVWRFFPVMAAEAREMRQASLLRVHQKGSRLKAFFRGFVVPMAFCMVEYADQVALTLEVRGFCPQAARSCYNPPKLGVNDAVYLGLAAACAAMAAMLQWSGWI
jgi:energy-coupling factor transport system permease protein